jgi:S1-C subfamily serine protease
MTGERLTVSNDEIQRTASPPQQPVIEFNWKPITGAPQTAAEQARHSLSVEANRPSVARIETVDKSKMPDGSPRTTGGTGFFVTKDGVLATDYHVVRDANGIYVTTADGVKHTATIKSVDVKTDLALLQVAPITNETFRPVELAQSSGEISQFTNVFTIGHPKRIAQQQVGLGSNNVLTSLDKFKLDEKSVLPGEDPKRKLIITSTLPVQTGNSGGFLARESDGAVVAVIGFQDLDRGGSLSTPVEDLRRLMAASGVTPTDAKVAARIAPFGLNPGFGGVQPNTGLGFDVGALRRSQEALRNGYGSGISPFAPPVKPDTGAYQIKPFVTPLTTPNSTLGQFSTFQILPQNRVALPIK